MTGVLTLLLSHQAPDEVQSVLDLWQTFRGPEEILLAYGGEWTNFEQIAFPSKVFIPDPRLRVTEQQRNKQSCTAVFQAAGKWLRSHPQFGYVHYVEFDQLPLRRDLYKRLLDRINEEGADVLAYHLQRIDRTSRAQYLYHAHEPRFHRHFAEISVREDRDVILQMLGTGSFWRREAFEAVAAHEEPFPVYMELYLPTLAHHLGFRLRDFAEQNEFVTALGDRSGQIDQQRAAGAWMVHPVKRLPQPWRAIVQ